MEPNSYTPSLLQDIRTNAFGAAIIGIVTPLTFFFLRSGRFKPTSMSFHGLVIVGICAGLLTFFVLLWRFLMKAPKSVEISDRGVILKFRGDRREEMAWEEITAVSLTDDLRLMWRFEGADSRLCLREDGFSSREWGCLSRDIAEKLKLRGIQITPDKDGARYLKGLETGNP